VCLGYSGLAARKRVTRQAFGSGFGYASFEMTGAVAQSSEDGGWDICVTVRNISSRAGAEVVQVYRTEPELTLVAFTKVWLQPREAQTIRMPMAARRLQIWRDGWQSIPGPIALLIGRSSNELPLAVTIHPNS
jgi:beta-glucosidase